MTTLRQQLAQTYRTGAARLPPNPAVRSDTRRGKERRVLSPLEQLAEPPSRVALRAAVAARLPRVDLPELFLESIARPGFATAFPPGRARTAHVDHFAVRLCAVLLAEACNSGREPLVCQDVPALQRARVVWVRQHALRTETLTEGKALLGAAQHALPLVPPWGGGDVASAAGLRCVVPLRTVHAGPTPQYDGHRQGGTYDHLVFDHSTGLPGMPVPGTLRDSLGLLSVLLEQPTELHPTDILTDAGAYPDVIFGLCRLLGYRCMPR
jgi:Tn3 transposase DDE domain